VLQYLKTKKMATKQGLIPLAHQAYKAHIRIPHIYIEKNLAPSVSYPSPSRRTPRSLLCLPTAALPLASGCRTPASACSCSASVAQDSCRHESLAATPSANIQLVQAHITQLSLSLCSVASWSREGNVSLYSLSLCLVCREAGVRKATIRCWIILICYLWDLRFHWVVIVSYGILSHSYFNNKNRMHKRLICAPETVAHISRQISNVPLQCLLHSGI